MKAFLQFGLVSVRRGSLCSPGRGVVPHWCGRRRASLLISLVAGTPVVFTKHRFPDNLNLQYHVFSHLSCSIYSSENLTQRPHDDTSFRKTSNAPS